MPRLHSPLELRQFHPALVTNMAVGISMRVMLAKCCPEPWKVVGQ
jgi:hypothetical protein